MNKKRIMALLLSSAMIIGTSAALVGCDKNPDDNNPNKPGKAEKLTVWVSETEGVKELTKTQIDTFINANENYKGKYQITVEGVTEGEAATQMVTDVTSGADIYCFAQDQLGRLIEAKALSKLGKKATQFVEENNDAGSARAVKVDGDAYAYPITSDNGYFMYYDKSVVKTDINDLQAIVNDCEAAGKKFAFEVEGSAWYTASFFFGAGCTSSWKMDTKTNKWVAADNFNSDKGLIALKGMQILTKSSAYVNSSKAAEFGTVETDADGNPTTTGGAAVVVSGTWDATTAKKKLGDNFGVAKLPSYKVDGKTYQLGSYSGYKLMGVKPHENTDTQAFCNELAQYLSGEKCQEERFDLKEWGPSNKAVQAMDKVKTNEALAALAQQSEFATPQGTIHGGWWDFAKLLGKVSKDAKNDDELKAGLENYQAALNKYEQMTEEDMNAFGVVGSIASLAGVKENLAAGQNVWSDWSTDVKMAKTEKDGKTIWKTVVKINLQAGDQILVRKGQAWDTQYGAVGEDGYSTKSNFAITAENAGEFYVVLTLDGDKGVVSLSAE